MKSMTVKAEHFGQKPLAVTEVYTTCSLIFVTFLWLHFCTCFFLSFSMQVSFVCIREWPGGKQNQRARRRSPGTLRFLQMRRSSQDIRHGVKSPGAFLNFGWTTNHINSACRLPFVRLQPCGDCLVLQTGWQLQLLNACAWTFLHFDMPLVLQCDFCVWLWRIDFLTFSSCTKYGLFTCMQMWHMLLYSS